LAAAGAAILIKGSLQRDALRDGLTSALARHQGDELLVIMLVVVTGVALVHVGLSLARAGGYLRSERSLPRGFGYAVWSFAAGVAIVLLVAVIASGDLHQRWENFKDPYAGLQEGRNTQFSRLSSASGNGRYQYWVSSFHAFEHKPLTGIGSGSFETWWARHATLSGTVRNAHSLYAETLGELGVIGIALVAALFLLIIAAGVGTTLRSTGPPRAVFAGIVAACSAFVVSAGVDWAWQITVLPACFLLLAVALLRGRTRESLPSSRLGVAGLMALSVAALVALLVPLASATQLRDSQQAAGAMRYDPALRHAVNAGRLEPYGSSPALQRALVLELRGDLNGAVAAARTAERNEPMNWRAPFVLARLETERGHVNAALAAFRRARALNKESSFLR
jgi:O-antigen ligase